MFSPILNRKFELFYLCGKFNRLKKNIFSILATFFASSKTFTKTLIDLF
jgi:hypothetical protein